MDSNPSIGTPSGNRESPPGLPLENVKDSTMKSQSADETMMLKQKVEALESRLSKVESKESASTGETSSGDSGQLSTKIVESLSQANYMTIEEYDGRKFSFQEEHCAFDVVMSATWRPGSDAPGELPGPSEQDHDLPRFVQVNSLELSSLLERHLADRDRHLASRFEQNRKPYVILAPFKSICYNVGLLRSLQWSESENRIVEPNQMRPLNHELATFEGIKAWKDLQCFIDFLDKHVLPWWTDMRGVSKKAVRFGDLCGLFQPGDLVFVPHRPQQVYRVVKITGGRPSLSQLYLAKTGQGSSAHDEIREPENKEKSFRQWLFPGEASAEDRNYTTFRMTCYSIAFNGKSFGLVGKQFEQKYFSGAKDIKQLEQWPARFLEQNVRDEHVENGKRYLDRSMKRLQFYEGRTLTQNLDQIESRSPWDEERPRKILVSRDLRNDVVVDFDMTFQYNPSWAPSLNNLKYASQKEKEDHAAEVTLPKDAPILNTNIQYLDFYDNQQCNRFRNQDKWIEMSEKTGDVKHDEVRNMLAKASGTGEDDYMLLPNRVFGYIPHTQEWACFDVTNKVTWSPTKESSDNWNQLQLPWGHKEHLESLMEWHLNTRNDTKKRGMPSLNFDFIRGKGEGLVILLHGAPGVGKTSTAESMAKKYNMPLLPITCANLGLEAESVDKALALNFRLAESWDAIILLDEADIFLARRERKDLQRNALVSVFLRTLEYYTGILILTTNRPGDFDEAFRSRINIGLFYPHLTREMTEALWKSSLDRLVQHLQSSNNVEKITVKDDGAITRFGMKHFEAYVNMLGRAPWNGRQIRNAFQTAVALAKHDAWIQNSQAASGTFDDLQSASALLTWEVFRKVALATHEFEVYLADTHGFTDDELAADDKFRRNYALYEHDERKEQNDRSYRKSRRRVPQDIGRSIIQSLHPDQPIPYHFAPTTSNLPRPASLNDNIPPPNQAAMHMPSAAAVQVGGSEQNRTSVSSDVFQHANRPQGWYANNAYPAGVQSQAGIQTYGYPSSQHFAATQNMIPQQQGQYLYPYPSSQVLPQQMVPVQSGTAPPNSHNTSQSSTER